MSNHVNDWIADFIQSDFYQDINQFPAEMVSGMLRSEAIAIKEQFGRDLGQLNGQQFFDFLALVAEQAEADTDPDAHDFLLDTYQVSRAFFVYLAFSHRLKVSANEMVALLAQFEAEYRLVEEPNSRANDKPLSMNDDPRLPEWRDYVAADIRKYIRGWLDAYFQSPQWRCKHSKLSADKLDLAVTSLADKVYDWHRKTPKTWTKKALREVMTTYWVANVDFTPAEYPLLVPAISDFLAFVGDQGWLNAQKVANYRRYMQAIEPEMLTQAKDQKNYGFAKMIGQALQQAGIDPSDQAAVANYLEQLNRRGGVDALYAEESEPDPEPEDLREILANPDQLREAAAVYDPDPDQDYLQKQHVFTIDDRTWRRRTAIEVHALAIQFGLRLWLTEKTYVKAQGYDAADTVAMIGEFVDTMYAQHVQTPKQWTVEAWRDFGEWLHRYSLEDRRGIRQGNVFAKLALVLGEAGIINATQAQRLAAAMQGKPENIIDITVAGKQLSKKQLKRLIKKRRHR